MADKAAGLDFVLSGLGGGGSASPSPADSPDMDLDQVANDVIAAVEARDAQALAGALRAFIDIATGGG